MGERGLAPNSLGDRPSVRDGEQGRRFGQAVRVRSRGQTAALWVFRWWEEEQRTRQKRRETMVWLRIGARSEAERCRVWLARGES